MKKNILSFRIFGSLRKFRKRKFPTLREEERLKHQLHSWNDYTFYEPELLLINKTNGINCLVYIKNESNLEKFSGNENYDFCIDSKTMIYKNQYSCIIASKDILRRLKAEPKVGYFEFEDHTLVRMREYER